MCRSGLLWCASHLSEQLAQNPIRSRSELRRAVVPRTHFVGLKNSTATCFFMLQGPGSKVFSQSLFIYLRGVFRLAAMTKTLTWIAVLRHASSRCKDIDTFSGLSLFIHLRRVLRLAAVTGPSRCGC